jgi:hypothetical protein
MSGVVLTVEVAPFRRQDSRIGGRSVGGFEIRPVTGAEVEALAAGRCTCGCQDIPDEGLAPVARELPVGAPAWVAGLDLDFAANVDGRWAPSWAAFETQLRRQHAAEQELLRFAGVPPDQAPARVLFTVGVAVAKDWTLGQRDGAPFIRYSPMPVANETVRMVIAAGEEVVASSAEPSWFAEGALAWLRWITGQAPEVVYPPTG